VGPVSCEKKYLFSIAPARTYRFPTRRTFVGWGTGGLRWREFGQKFRTEILNLKTAKESGEKHRLELHLFLGKENF